MYRKLLLIAAVMLLLIIPVSAYTISPAGDFRGGNGCTEGNLTIWTGENITFSFDSGDVAYYNGNCGGGVRNSVQGFGPVAATGTIQLNYAAGNALWYICPSSLAGCYNYFIYNATPKPAHSDVTFSISETGNFTKKLSGAVITLSNAQTATTNTSGMADIEVFPNSSAYTYGVTKTGYGTLAAQSLGGYGETGGTVYVEMESGTSGNVRTYVQAVDGATGGQVHNSNIQLKDVNQSLWTNVTNDFDGTHFIDTLQSTTINAYADMTGYTSSSRLGLAPFNEGMYEIVLWPAGSLLNPGPGNVNLIVLVNDRTTSAPISSASVSAMPPSGEVEGSATGTTGTVTFVVPNMSVIHVTAKKDGYTAGTGTITTTAFGPDTLRIELTKATVTPVVTATPLPGEVTARPTYIPGCEPGGDPVLCQRNTDSSLWATLRQYSSVILTLGIITVIFGLFKLIGKW
jgi:hypothetical protein